MNYKFKYNLVKEKDNNGEKTIEKFPLVYKVNNVRSREEAINRAKKALNGYCFEYSDSSEKYSIEIVDIERLPEKAPVLPTNYFKYYNEILGELRRKLAQNDLGNLKLLGTEGLKCYGELEYLLKAPNGSVIDVLIDKNSLINMTIRINGTTLYYCENGNQISGKCRPFLLSGRAHDDTKEIKFTYLEDGSMSYGKYIEDQKLFQSVSLDNFLKEIGLSDESMIYSLNSFTEAIPEFSAKEIEKKQKAIQEAFEKKFNKSQKRICDAENLAFRSKYMDKPNKNEVFDFDRL